MPIHEDPLAMPGIPFSVGAVCKCTYKSEFRVMEQKGDEFMGFGLWRLTGIPKCR